ncbi:MAG: glycosyltransferase family 2 protein [Nitrospirae bacterium]|nr:glycosyltransferase family 2 protein [Nitrospirota bacterium]
MKLSICIPTYNRAAHLANCINSIVLCNSQANFMFQVCISDNHSTDETEEVVRTAQSVIDIKYQRNSSNLGIPRNFLNVVNMADGDFIWLIGDDDLLMPNAVAELYDLIDAHPSVDFFFVNSFHLSTAYLEKYPSPFDTANLPKSMIPFSSWGSAGEMSFWGLINPEISFDFLGGMFLSVFRKKNWELNANVLDENLIQDVRTFSHFDNTFPHVKIFAHAFSSSKAYFNVKPLNVCLTGAREWAPMYPFVRSVRLVEALGEYKKNGLPFIKYIQCKNFALRNFLPDLAYMFIHRNISGLAYVKPLKLIFSNCLFPNFYFSVIYYLIRKLKTIIRRG